MKTKYLILGVLIVLVLAVGAYAGITFWQISDLESILLDTDFPKEVRTALMKNFQINMSTSPYWASTATRRGSSMPTCSCRTFWRF